MNLKYVQKVNGRFRYRRKVPHSLRSRLGKGEIIAPLGCTEAEVLKRYPVVDADAERELATALAPTPNAKPISAATALQEYQAARLKVRELGFDPKFIGESSDEWQARGNLADAILSKYPLDEEGDPEGVTTQDELVVKLLYAGERERAPAPTLQDAIDLYRKEKVRGDDKNEKQLANVFQIVSDVLPLQTRLADLRKDGAKEVRDHMLDGRKPASVNRYLNVIRAVVNYANDQLEVENPRNPFMKLEAAPRDKAEPDKDKRRSFTEEELRITRQRILSRSSVDLQLIWRMLEGTGCRLAEVTGLRVEDIKLDHEIPHIVVEWHDDRRVKNAVSTRNVPLVGDALEAAKEAHGRAKGRTKVFERYCRPGGAASASAALGKQVRECVTDTKVVTHSLRHRMKDLLRLAGISKADQDIVLGHSSGSVGEDYGGDNVRLKVAERAIRRSLALG